MARPTRQSTAREIQPDQWIPFCTAFTQENRGAHAVLEIIKAEDVGYEVELENRPLEGISADVKGGEHTIWMTFGARPNDHFAHGIHNATVLRSLPPSGSRGAVLQVEDK